MEWITFIGAVAFVTWMLWGRNINFSQLRSTGNARDYLKQAYDLIDKEDYDGALAQCNKAINRNPHDTLPYIIRGMVYTHKEDYERALVDFDWSIELEPRSEQAHMRKSYALMRLKRYDDAIASYTETLAVLDKEQARTEKYSAYLRASGNLPHENKTSARASIYHARAYVYILANRVGDAMNDWQEAEKLAPGVYKPQEWLVRAYLDRGSQQYTAGDMDAAIADYTTALEHVPDDPTALNNRGEAYFTKGDYDAARTDFEAALTHKPEMTIALAGKAVTLHALGETETARRIWNELVAEDDQYGNIAWVKDKLRWSDALADEAARLIDSLGN